MTDLLTIYNKYPIIGKALNFINLTNSSNNCHYHGIDHLFTVFEHCVHVLNETHENLITHELELYLAALFHDYEHKGKMGNDFENIDKAKKGVLDFYNIYPEFDINEVLFLISCTEYPYIIKESDLTYEAKILRDADMSYLLQDISIVKLYYGLRTEFNMNLIDFINGQINFFNNLKFYDTYTQLRWISIKNNRIAELEYLKNNI